ncbi:MAG: hypothetical protein HKP54_07260, partial [Boseongicola sp.]|nr:hypothetical protein [Boseongicola sp.]
LHLHINPDAADAKRVQIVLSAIAAEIEGLIDAKLLASPGKLVKSLRGARR